MNDSFISTINVSESHDNIENILFIVSNDKYIHSPTAFKFFQIMVIECRLL